ncbi:MAG: hypothetical protein IT329_07405 [Caldilineaceae bacterium]|nr:hypothetical protein [Caldilineaceae bacterium]
MKLRWPTLLVLIAATLLFATLAPSPAQAQSAGDTVWIEQGADGETKVHLYFFWSLTCPHCREAHPFVEALPQRYPWLVLHSLELTENRANAIQYDAMARSLGQEAMYVPAFFFCEQMGTGYDTAETTGQALVEALETCYAKAVQQTATQDQIAAAEGAAAGAVAIPWLGTLDAERLSLPVFTAVLAGLDAFNPCAFFVLLFLLSLMVHAQDRRRMLLVGGVFVLISGLVYFIFMAAWLNVFLWAGELKAITLIAGLVAMAIALINIKDYFWFKQGVSLSIPERAKPGLYQRMRNLVRAGSLPAMVAGTAVLAAAANSYELLCTSGFPMVYTRVLTLEQLAPGAYYGYLAAYNLIYILPLLAIVTLFSIKFGTRKLSEDEGRALKLLSGVMMFALGAVLVFAPALLNQVWTAVALLAGAVGLTALVVWWNRRTQRRSSPKPPSKPGTKPPAKLSGRLRPH